MACAIQLSSLRIVPDGAHLVLSGFEMGNVTCGMSSKSGFRKNLGASLGCHELQGCSAHLLPVTK